MIDTQNQLIERRALPRERLLHAGIESLHDEELIALMIGNGVAGSPVARVSHAVMRAIDQANGPPETAALIAIPGLGPAKAASICAGFEIARRVLCPGHRKVRAPSDILPVVDRFIERKQECFLAISLNGAHEITATRVVTVGLVNRTVVHPREVFAGPLADRAAAIILAHNHPSGSLEPSAEDGEVTRRLVSAGQLLGIPVLDHVIFSSRGYYSFLEHEAL